MQELDSIVKIAEIILFIALAAAAIYLIISLRKITTAVDKLEQSVEHIETKLEPVLENALVVTQNMNRISTSVSGQMAKVEDIVDSVKERTDSIIDFEKKAQRELETHVFDSLNFISAIVTGVKTFVNRVSGSRRNGKAHRKHREYIEESSEDSY